VTQKLNVPSAVEFRQILFQCFRICFPEVGQKKSKKMVQRLRMFLATGKLAFLAYFLLIFSTRVSGIKSWSAEPLVKK